MNKYLPFLLLLSVLFFSCSTTKHLTTSNARSQRDTLSQSSKNKNALTAKYSSILNVKESDLNDIELLSFIDDWYGASYKYGGNTKEGVDCSDFACILYQNVYNINIVGSSQSLRDQCSSIKKDELQEGDLIFFKIRKGHISHVGIYLINNYFVHASTKAGVIINNLDEDYYRKYYCCAGRIKRK